MGIKSKNIGEAYRGKQNTSKGYKWDLRKNNTLFIINLLSYKGSGEPNFGSFISFSCKQRSFIHLSSEICVNFGKFKVTSCKNCITVVFTILICC